MTNTHKKSKLGIFFSYFRPHRKLFAIDMACAVTASAIDLAFPYISRMSMEKYLPENMYRTFFT